MLVAPLPSNESTCWTVIRGAAKGRPADREELARRYQGIVKAYLTARWKVSPLSQEVGDAGQEVFVECFRQGGVLEAVDQGRVPRFRAFLYGVIRNVARRFECRPTPPAALPWDVPSPDEDQATLFEKTWAQAIMAEAGHLLREQALKHGPEALKRVELLQLKFRNNLPVREIAQLWGEPAERVHHAYAHARKEFRAVLLEVIAFHQPGTPAEIEAEAADLLRVLS